MAELRLSVSFLAQWSRPGGRGTVVMLRVASQLLRNRRALRALYLCCTGDAVAGKLLASAPGCWVVWVREHSPDRNSAFLTPLSRSRVDNSFFRCVAITIGISACTLRALRHLLPPYEVVSSSWVVRATSKIVNSLIPRE